MHSILHLFFVLQLFIYLAKPIIVPTGAGLLQNISTHSGLAVNAGEKEYTVFPREPQRVATVDNAIKRLAVRDSVRTITDQYRPEYGYVLYWQLRATEAAAQQLVEELGSDAYLFETKKVAEQADIRLAQDLPQPNVTAFFQSDESDGLLGDTVSARQRNAPEELRVVSWPPGKLLANIKGYLYDTHWQMRPTVYIIDSGLDTTSTDFQLGIDKWFYSPIVKAQRKDTPTDDEANSHGSCVFSKAIGITNGVYKNAIGFRAKNSKVVVLKVDINLGFGEILWAFATVRTDIRNSPRAPAAVVAFPWTAYHSDPIPWTDIKTVFQQIFDLGGTIIVPSGNNAATPGRQDVDTLPASWESPTFPLIVVGAVDDTGSIPPFSQGPTHVTVWAPGVNVQCARRYGFRLSSGTSGSTGMVAGLAAYALALGRVNFVSSINTPTAVKNWLVNAASWVRLPPTGPRVVWNMEWGY